MFLPQFLPRHYAQTSHGRIHFWRVKSSPFRKLETYLETRQYNISSELSCAQFGHQECSQKQPARWRAHLTICLIFHCFSPELIVILGNQIFNDVIDVENVIMVFLLLPRVNTLRKQTSSSQMKQFQCNQGGVTQSSLHSWYQFRFLWIS